MRRFFALFSLAGRNLLLATLLAVTSGAALAQTNQADATVNLPMTFHGESPSLRELQRQQIAIAPGNGKFRWGKAKPPLFEEPAAQWKVGEEPAEPSVQVETTQSLTATSGVSFEGPGEGLAGFSMSGAPPDMTLAVGPNHIAAWVNSQYVVFDKTGTTLLGPVNGNSLFSGVGNVCETTNRGDPILQYDRLADRWILSQFAFDVSGGSPVAPYFQCFAVSTTGDPTGSYVRYSVEFSSVSPSGFNDYGKLGVWPDGYYTAYNIFGGSPAGGNTGVALCVSDRVKMLASDPAATTLCAPIDFYAFGAAFLPADLDGTTLPSDLSQGGIFMRQSSSPALRYMKLKPDFAAGTVTLTDGFGGGAGSYINLPLPATTAACNGSGGACIAQPETQNQLDTIGRRLMYRLAFRNRDGVESMVVTHSVDPDGAGPRGAALRWYEIRNPLGDPGGPFPDQPVLYQNGTFDEGASGDRWMGSIATDKFGNMLIGYSLADAPAGLKPSIAITGRQLSDPLNTMQAETIAITGTGSQTGTLERWGDYSTMQIDPVDDRTFWFISQYLSSNGTFNWRTRIVSYKFPAPQDFSISDARITEGDTGNINMDFTVSRSGTGSSDSVDYAVVAGGSATDGVDYETLVNNTLNFANADTSMIVSVSVIGDTVIEPDETVFLELSNPSGSAAIDDASGVGTIENDDFPLLSVSLTGNGIGAVTSSPSGIDCGLDCSESYDYNTEVILTATPETGSNFSGFSGDADCEDGSVNMTAPVNCNATFELDIHSLTVVLDGNGAGVVTSAPAGIDCGSACTEDYDYDSAVMLTAFADTGSNFVGFSGDKNCEDEILTMTIDVNCTATFELDTFVIGGTVNDLVGEGLVLQNNDGDDLSVNASGIFNFATPILDGETYDVSVGRQPDEPAEVCRITNGMGSVATEDVAAVIVNCTIEPLIFMDSFESEK